MYFVVNKQKRERLKVLFNIFDDAIPKKGITFFLSALYLNLYNTEGREEKKRNGSSE
jgi:hypothetical protein